MMSNGKLLKKTSTKPQPKDDHYCARNYSASVHNIYTEINTIFIDRLLTCRVFRRVHPTLGSESLTVYHEVLQILRMKRHILN